MKCLIFSLNGPSFLAYLQNKETQSRKIMCCYLDVSYQSRLIFFFSTKENFLRETGKIENKISKNGGIRKISQKNSLLI